VYMNFLSQCYIDTEVEVKEIYTSPSMWTLFENFLVDMALVSTDTHTHTQTLTLTLTPTLTLTLTSHRPQHVDSV